MSMKTLKTLLWSLFCLTLFVACSDDPSTLDPNTKPGPETPSVPKNSEIVLAKTSVTAGLGGGNYSIEYSIKNPVEDGTKIVASAAESWVKDFNYNSTGLLRFTVEPNTSNESRTCLVTVDYRYAKEPVAFTVKQGAKINKGFTIENVTSTYFDYTVDVIPDDKTTPYIVMSAHPEYIIASGFQTGEDFYQDDLAYFAWLGQFYAMSPAQVMQSRAKVGDQPGVRVSGAAPGVPYTFYCYYFDYESGALLSDVQMFTVKTTSPQLQNVDFEMSGYNTDELVDGCMAPVNVTPVGYEGDYYFDVLPKALIDSYLYDLVDLNGNQYFTTVEQVVEYWWSNAVVDMMQQMSALDIIANYTCVGENPDGTPKSYYEFELLANFDYYLFAYTMEENGLCSSVPQVKEFRTGSVQPSDIVITPEVSKITARTAKFTFTPSNDDYYVAGWEKAADWATYGNNDAERQNYLLHNMDYALLKGAQATDVLNLESDTEYVLYAFGSRGGVATTPTIYTVNFKTKSGEAGNVQISFKDLGYYDAADFESYADYAYLANYAGYAILPLEVEFSDEEHGEWFMDIYDWTGRYDVYTDQQYMDGLVWAINEYGGLTATHTYTILEFGREYEIAAVVLDTEGQFSSLYRLWVKPNYDGVGNVEDYVNWWDAYQESLNQGGGELQSLVIEKNADEFFSKKCRGAKVSAQSFEVEEAVVDHNEIISRR